MSGNGTTYVVLVNWSQYDYTSACVRSLLEFSHPGLRILVVDNGSTDQSPSRLAADFGEKIDILCNQENLGFSGGNNVGIRHALAQGADFILLLNNDTIVAPDFLSPMLQRLDADRRVGAVTAKIYYVHEPNVLWAAGGTLNPWLGRAQNRGCGERDCGQYEVSQAVDYVTGCCILARREAFENVGLLDERYFAYFEDADWCLRVREAGFTCWYEPNSHIWHWAGAASKRQQSMTQTGSTDARIYYLVTRNNLWFLRDHVSRKILPIAIVSLFVRHMLFYTGAFVALRRWAKLGALWRGWGDGWKCP